MPVKPKLLSLESRERLAQHVRLGTGHALRESRQRGDSVARLVKRGQHQFSHV